MGPIQFTHLRMDNLRRDIEDAMAEGSLSLVPRKLTCSCIYVSGILSLLVRSAKTGLSRAEVEAHWAFCCAGPVLTLPCWKIFSMVKLTEPPKACAC